MIDSIIQILESWLPIWSTYLIDIFCLGFLAFVGCFLHAVFRR